MRVTILTFGLRGDVQPFIALALDLKKAGYDVLLTAPSNFKDLITCYGVDYSPICTSTREILSLPHTLRWLNLGFTIPVFLAFGNFMHRHYRELISAMLSACEHADIVIAYYPIEAFAKHVSEKLQHPLILADIFPARETGKFPHIFLTSRKLPGFLSRLSYKWFDALWGLYSRHIHKEIRIMLGLPPQNYPIPKSYRKQKLPILHGFSQLLVSKPIDWGDEHILTGFWTFPQHVKRKTSESRSIQSLKKWLNQGTAPIFFGFGSMPLRYPKTIVQMIIDVIAELDARAIIATGHTIIQIAHRDNIFMIDFVDHEWLFPQCACVIHHGGSGTTAASLRAGVPTIICSFFADQAFWGTRIAYLGVGYHIPFKKFTKNKLVEIIRKANDEKVRHRATILGNKLRTENGVENAVQAIQRQLSTMLCMKSNIN